jgi:hypothetical protein
VVARFPCDECRALGDAVRQDPEPYKPSRFSLPRYNLIIHLQDTHLDRSMPNWRYYAILDGAVATLTGQSRYR